MDECIQPNIDDNTSQIIFCFSVTLWIHINYGDDGLKTFLKQLANSCNYLIIEPQPWKCYKTAVRRAKRANRPPFEHFAELKFRENVTEFIDSFLVEQCGMTRMTDLGTTSWDRKISLYSRVDKGSSRIVPS